MTAVPSAASAFLQAIIAFKPATPLEAAHQAIIAEFVATHRDPFNRSHLDAHVTGSALIVSSDGLRVLLGLHRKLERWLRPGGHGEPDEICAETVAKREAIEETGMDDLTLHPSAPRPIDLDVHEIPARGSVPLHRHLDVRYLFLASEGAQPLHREEEHTQMRWFTWDEAAQLDLDVSLRRLLEKAFNACCR